MNDLSSTGERQHTEEFDWHAMEHLHRYTVAGGLCAGLEVLDIASGEGYGSNILAGSAKNVTGVDISAEAVEHASATYNRENLRYIQGSTDSIPLADHSVDCVISFETIEHHDRHEQMLTEIKRVLRPDGFVVVSTPDKLNYTDRPNIINKFHVKELYENEFKELMGKYFKQISVYYQRVDCYGLISCDEPRNDALVYFTGDFDRVHSSTVLPMPMYDICIASDAHVPVMGSSVFTGYPVFEHLKRLADQRLDEINRLQAILENARNEMNDMRGSLSYSIGSALLSPLKLIRNVFK